MRAILLIALLSLAGCGTEKSSTTFNVPALPECNAENEGKKTYDFATQKAVVCEDSKWVPMTDDQIEQTSASVDSKGDKGDKGDKEIHFWIKDLVLMRAEAPARNSKITEVARRDTPRIPIIMEDYGAYKDAFNEMKTLLVNHNITGQHLHKDKSAKAAGLEPVFEHSRIHIPVNAPWKDEFVRQFSAFPDGVHDDIVDACAILYNDSSFQTSSILVPKF